MHMTPDHWSTRKKTFWQGYPSRNFAKLIYGHIFRDTDNKFFINSFCDCLSSNFATLALSSTFSALILLFSALILSFSTSSLAMHIFNELVSSISDCMLA